MKVRYELRNGELAVFFNADEINVALAHENSMHRPRGLSSGELLYACVVDSINEKSGVPTMDWRKSDAAHRIERVYPESLTPDDGQFLVRTLDGRSVAVAL
jgi:hypothetical protein